jgi:23S rRNA (uracil1939-C5)-methyltransferase
VAEILTIARIGARADGIAEADGAAIFVPRTLPGERVSVARDGPRARLLSVEAPSPERETPFCPYYESCGGCATQHMRHGFYQDWKRGTVVETLRRAGIEAPVEPLVDAHGDGRRRITLHARFPDGTLRVGYMEARSHAVVEIDHCPIAEPGLGEAAPRLARALARALAGPRKPLDIQITRTEGGFDVDLRGHGPVGDRTRQALIGLAEGLDLARLSVHGEALVERRPPVLTVGRASVVPPPGSFLQATRRGEAVLAGLAVEACAGAKRVADLFSGAGAFALRLAERAEVHAAEADRGAVAALDRAARATPGLRRVTGEARDLFRRPLLAHDLKGFDAVVLDPPRAGADAQARQIAESAVPLVVSVSCDAGTFARDARLLIDAGFRLERVVPVDQFKHSPHVELVGVLRREAGRKRR